MVQELRGTSDPAQAAQALGHPDLLLGAPRGAAVHGGDQDGLGVERQVNERVGVGGAGTGVLEGVDDRRQRRFERLDGPPLGQVRAELVGDSGPEEIHGAVDHGARLPDGGDGAHRPLSSRRRIRR